MTSNLVSQGFVNNYGGCDFPQIDSEFSFSVPTETESGTILKEAILRFTKIVEQIPANILMGAASGFTEYGRWFYSYHTEDVFYHLASGFQPVFAKTFDYIGQGDSDEEIKHYMFGLTEIAYSKYLKEKRVKTFFLLGKKGMEKVSQADFHKFLQVVSQMAEDRMLTDIELQAVLEVKKQNRAS